jgi:hypothetical protein
LDRDRGSPSHRNGANKDLASRFTTWNGRSFQFYFPKKVFRKGVLGPGRNFLLIFYGFPDSSELRKAPLQAFKVDP